MTAAQGKAFLQCQQHLAHLPGLPLHNVGDVVYYYRRFAKGLRDAAACRREARRRWVAREQERYDRLHKRPPTKTKKQRRAGIPDDSGVEDYDEDEQREIAREDWEGEFQRGCELSFSPGPFAA